MELHQNYAKDLVALKYGSVDTEMTFSNPASRVAHAQEPTDA